MTKHYAGEYTDPEEDAEIERYIDSIKKSVGGASPRPHYYEPSPKQTGGGYEPDSESEEASGDYYGDSDYNPKSSSQRRQRRDGAVRRGSSSGRRPPRPSAPSDNWADEMRRMRAFGDGTSWYDY